jgi:hypothetical protein
MPTGFGTNAWVGFGEESTYGTGVTPTKWIEVLEESFQGKHNYIGKPTLRSASINQRVKSKKAVEGGFKYNVGFEGYETLFKHTIGSVATTGPVSGIYTHTFSLATVLPTGLTFQVNRDQAAIGGSSAFQYEGCQIQKLTLTQNIEDFLMADIEIVGEDWSNVALTAATFPTFQGVDWEMLTTFTINAVAVKVKELEITIENALAADRYRLGSRLRRGLGRNAPRKISGKFLAEFESLTEYAYYRDLIQVPLVATWDNGGAGSAQRQLSISIPAIVFNGEDPKVDDAGPIELPMSFEAFQSAAANDEMVLTVKNTLSSV